MVTHIAVCGDSFGVGMGLPDDRCFEDNFSGVVSSYFDLPQKVYARSGCCNMTIFLQVEKIIQQIKRDKTYEPFVLITTTFHERIIFPLDDGFKYKNPDLSDIEYLSYNPYHEMHQDVNKNYSSDWKSPHRKLEFEPSNNPRLITETISNIQHYQAGKAHGIARLFIKVNKRKFQAIRDYFLELFDTGIKKKYDDSLFVHMHLLLKHYNIPHLIMGMNLPTIIDKKNNFQHNWGFYIKKYPDGYGSGHCNETGNKKVGEHVIKHIKDNKLL